MINKKINDPPEKDPQEQAMEIMLWLAKGASIPTVIGPWLIDIADKLFKRPNQNRTNEWMQQVADAINEISAKQNDMTLVKLAENNEFVTILHKACELAIKTHQKEKRDLLRNAIVSAGSSNPPDFDRQVYFLKLIDDLTVNQILILALYDNPLEWFNKHGKKPHEFMAAARIEVVKQAYPELSSSPDFMELVIGGLERTGLMSGLIVVVHGNTVYNSPNKQIAHDFLKYVCADKILN
jgi:hypothetical protein